VPEESWLDKLTQSTDESESPERFYYWAGVAAISAVAKRNSWLNRYRYKLYPNVYIILVSAKSGLRKGLPVSDAKNIVELVGNTRILSGRFSIQGVIKELSTQRTLSNGKVVNDAQAFLCAPELKGFLVSDDQSMDIMTDLQNTHEHEKEWKNTLKGSPVEALIKPCITFLGASNEIMFEAALQSKDIQGGFIARTFIIHESKRRMINSLTKAPKNFITNEELAVHLKRVAELPPGEFTWDDEVREHYDRWYHRLVKVSETYDDRTGTLERIGDQCLKLVMVVSLSKRLTRVITLEDMEEAIAKCEEYFASSKHVLSGQGASDLAAPVKKTLGILLVSPQGIERSILLKKLWPDVSHITLDEIIELMGPNGMKIVRAFRENNLVMYQLTDETFEKYRNLGDKDETKTRFDDTSFGVG